MDGRWRTRVVRRALVGAVVLLCFGCDALPTRPLDPALTGDWIGPPGVDTWDGFTLQQRGTLVTGTHDFYSANFGGSVHHVPIGGTAELPRVTLTWQDGNYVIVATGTLAADSMQLILTDSAMGQPGHGQPQVYRRKLMLFE